MGALDGRVVIITGAGRGLGREHALLMASEGAKVVVNDLGGNMDGTGADRGPAQEVVDEIKAMGGEAVANTDSVTSWEGGQRMVNAAVEAFGDLHVLVNNAGILRDRVLVNMTEEEWDAIAAVHLKGHFVPSRWAAAYWREKSKETGGPLKASIVNTASGAMLGNAGQTNYTAAKAGIAAATLVMAQELGRYGVRANCLAPVARTRLTLQTPGPGRRGGPAREPRPSSTSGTRPTCRPLVAYLATEDCPFTGGVFHVGGNEVGLYGGWSLAEEKILAADGRWTVEGLQAKAPRLLEGRKGLASVLTVDRRHLQGVRQAHAFGLSRRAARPSMAGRHFQKTVRYPWGSTWHQRRELRRLRSTTPATWVAPVSRHSGISHRSAEPRLDHEVAMAQPPPRAATTAITENSCSSSQACGERAQVTTLSTAIRTPKAANNPPTWP